MSRKTKVMITFGVLCLYIGCIGTILLQSDSNNSILAERDLAGIYGGSIGVPEGDCAKCETNDCEDIECTKGRYWDPETQKWVTMWMKGNDGDTADVTQCYQAQNSTCTATSGYGATNCEGDFWDSEGCFGSATHEDQDLYGYSCS